MLCQITGEAIHVFEKTSSIFPVFRHFSLLDCLFLDVGAGAWSGQHCNTSCEYELYHCCKSFCSNANGSAQFQETFGNSFCSRIYHIAIKKPDMMIQLKR